MSLPCNSHEAPRACNSDKPTREEKIEQNEHGSDDLTNAEQERTVPHFHQTPGQGSFQ